MCGPALRRKVAERYFFSHWVGRAVSVRSLERVTAVTVERFAGKLAAKDGDPLKEEAVMSDMDEVWKGRSSWPTSRRFPQTGRACRIVAGLDDFYDSRGVEEAEGAFKELYSWMRRCRLGPMKEAALALVRHKEKILASFKNRLTNAV